MYELCPLHAHKSQAGCDFDFSGGKKQLICVIFLRLEAEPSSQMPLFLSIEKDSNGNSGFQSAVIAINITQRGSNTLKEKRLYVLYPFLVPSSAVRESKAGNP